MCCCSMEWIIRVIPIFWHFVWFFATRRCLGDLSMGCNLFEVVRDGVVPLLELFGSDVLVSARPCVLVQETRP